MLPELTTARLALRPTTEADLESIVSVCNEPGVIRFLFDNQPVSAERAAWHLRNLRAHNARGLGAWCIRFIDAPALIGTAAIAPVGDAALYEPRLAGHVEPMIALTESVWGKRVGSEALNALVKYTFETLRLPTMVAAVDVPNEPSQKLMRAAGFQRLSEVQGFAGLLRTFVLNASSRTTTLV